MRQSDIIRSPINEEKVSRKETLAQEKNGLIETFVLVISSMRF